MLNIENLPYRQLHLIKIWLARNSLVSITLDAKSYDYINTICFWCIFKAPFVFDKIFTIINRAELFDSRFSWLTVKRGFKIIFQALFVCCLYWLPTSLWKSVFSTYSFVKLVFRLWLRCVFFIDFWRFVWLFLYRHRVFWEFVLFL